MNDDEELIDLVSRLDPKVYDDFCEINLYLKDAAFIEKLKKLINESTVIRYLEKERVEI